MIRFVIKIFHLGIKILNMNLLFKTSTTLKVIKIEHAITIMKTPPTNSPLIEEVFGEGAVKYNVANINVRQLSGTNPEMLGRGSGFYLLNFFFQSFAQKALHFS